jgi:hypothetical protein
VIYTERGLHFKNWVDERVDARHETCVEKKELNIIMDPEIAAIYRESKAVSMNQGASYLLLKASSKRRRTKEEIKHQDEEERQERLEVEAKMARYD